ncbi:hypothetical protein HDU82_004049 [Entophlyctis luteolus]|nr:hypothetical protein HDU82_004049 [Entophlyctis luteolus]
MRSGKSKKPPVSPNSAFDDIFKLPAPNPPKGSRPTSSSYQTKTRVKPLEPYDNATQKIQRKSSEIESSNCGKAFLKNRELSLRERERIYDVNLVTKDMPLYEPLLDGRLQDYFSGKNIRSHLVNVGLITEDDRVIPKKQFKRNQILLDKAEVYDRNCKLEKEQELDRHIEVCVLPLGNPQIYRVQQQAIRSQFRKANHRIENKLIDLPMNKPTTQKFPEVFHEYPVTMWKAVLTYIKPALATELTETELLKKLSKMRPSQMKEFGIDPAKMLPKLELLKSKLKRAKFQRKRTNRVVVHDDISDIELETATPIVKLFEMAKRKYQQNEIEDAKLLLQELVKLLNSTSTTPLSAAEAAKQSTTQLPESELHLVEYIKHLGGDVEQVKKKLMERKANSSERLTLQESESLDKPFHKRPSTARPSRDADFPVGTAFSDFGSDCGQEITQQIMANNRDLVFLSEPISLSPPKIDEHPFETDETIVPLIDGELNGQAGTEEDATNLLQTLGSAVNNSTMTTENVIAAGSSTQSSFERLYSSEDTFDQEQHGHESQISENIVTESIADISSSSNRNPPNNPPPNVPAPYSALWSEEYSRYYYFNTVTGESQWALPEPIMLCNQMADDSFDWESDFEALEENQNYIADSLASVNQFDEELEKYEDEVRNSGTLKLPESLVEGPASVQGADVENSRESCAGEENTSVACEINGTSEGEQPLSRFGSSASFNETAASREEIFEETKATVAEEKPTDLQTDKMTAADSSLCVDDDHAAVENFGHPSNTSENQTYGNQVVSNTDITRCSTHELAPVTSHNGGEIHAGMDSWDRETENPLASIAPQETNEIEGEKEFPERDGRQNSQTNQVTASNLDSQHSVVPMETSTIESVKPSSGDYESSGQGAEFSKEDLNYSDDNFELANSTDALPNIDTEGENTNAEYGSGYSQFELAPEEQIKEYLDENRFETTDELYADTSEKKKEEKIFVLVDSKEDLNYADDFEETTEPQNITFSSASIDQVSDANAQVGNEIDAYSENKIEKDSHILDSDAYFGDSQLSAKADSNVFQMIVHKSVTLLREETNAPTSDSVGSSSNESSTTNLAAANGPSISIISQDSSNNSLSSLNGLAPPTKRPSLMITAVVRRASMSPTISPIDVDDVRVSIARRKSALLVAAAPANIDDKDDLLDPVNRRPSRHAAEVFRRRSSAKSPLAQGISLSTNEDDGEDENSSFNDEELPTSVQNGELGDTGNNREKSETIEIQRKSEARPGSARKKSLPNMAAMMASILSLNAPESLSLDSTERNDERVVSIDDEEHERNRPMSSGPNRFSVAFSSGVSHRQSFQAVDKSDSVPIENTLQSDPSLINSKPRPESAQPWSVLDQALEDVYGPSARMSCNHNDSANHFEEDIIKSRIEVSSDSTLDMAAVMQSMTRLDSRMESKIEQSVIADSTTTATIIDSPDEGKSKMASQDFIQIDGDKNQWESNLSANSYTQNERAAESDETSAELPSSLKTGGADEDRSTANLELSDMRKMMESVAGGLNDPTDNVSAAQFNVMSSKTHSVNTLDTIEQDESRNTTSSQERTAAKSVGQLTSDTDRQTDTSLEKEDCRCTEQPEPKFANPISILEQALADIYQPTSRNEFDFDIVKNSLPAQYDESKNELDSVETEKLLAASKEQLNEIADFVDRQETIASVSTETNNLLQQTSLDEISSASAKMEDKGKSRSFSLHSTPSRKMSSASVSMAPSRSQSRTALNRISSTSSASSRPQEDGKMLSRQGSSGSVLPAQERIRQSVEETKTLTNVKDNLLRKGSLNENNSKRSSAAVSKSSSSNSLLSILRNRHSSFSSQSIPVQPSGDAGINRLPSKPTSARGSQDNIIGPSRRTLTRSSSSLNSIVRTRQSPARSGHSSKESLKETLEKAKMLINQSNSRKSADSLHSQDSEISNKELDNHETEKIEFSDGMQINMEEASPVASAESFNHPNRSSESINEAASANFSGKARKQSSMKGGRLANFSASSSRSLKANFDVKPPSGKEFTQDLPEECGQETQEPKSVWDDILQYDLENTGA